MKEENKGSTFLRGVLCHSILGREIPYYTLGTGTRTVLYVGGVRGTEQLLSEVLFEFMANAQTLHARDGAAFGRPVRELLGARRIVVVPCLNPDGVAYVQEGLAPDNPLASRVQAVAGDTPLTAWQANARGVALDKNFKTGHGAAMEAAWGANVLGSHPALWCGEYPESEPESAALARLARGIGADLLGVLELSAGSSEIRASCGEKLSAKTSAAGRILARATGLSLRAPTETPPVGGFFDWCLEELSRPAYRICVKPPEGTAPARATAVLYERLAKALFTFPYMV